MEIQVKQVYKVDTISKGNDNAWNKLISIVEESPKDEDILFDFLDINLIEPWGNETFRKLLGHENVRFRLYNSSRAAATINAACKLGNIKANRVENIEDEDVPVISKEEITLNRMTNDFEKLVYEEDGVAKFDIYKRLTQIGSADTVEAMGRAVINFCTKNGLKKALINTESIFIQRNIMEPISSIIHSGIKAGIIINILSEIPEVTEKVELYNCLADKNVLSDDEKAAIITNSIEPFTVGMLTQYRDSRAKDEFGRYGNGDVITCRVALFKGVTGSGIATRAHFRVYNGSTFFTKEHWGLEHDGEELIELTYEDKEIPMSELGFLNSHIGSKYHFIMPMQLDNKNYTMYGVNDNGSVEIKMVTIPVRIKMVFDDWGIEYNPSSLLNCIIETEKYLSENFKS